MSFLVDPPILFTTGQAYARLAPESAQGGLATAAGAAAIATIWGVGVPSYLNRRWTAPVWRALGAQNGRQFMWAYPLRAHPRKPGTGTHAFAAAAFASYPLWLWLGWDRGRRARPKG